jgi:hypothetical protein
LLSPFDFNLRDMLPWNHDQAHMPTRHIDLHFATTAAFLGLLGSLGYRRGWGMAVFVGA